jgi:hypothetical protein
LSEEKEAAKKKLTDESQNALETREREAEVIETTINRHLEEAAAIRQMNEA